MTQRPIKFRAWDKNAKRFLTNKDPYWCVSQDGKFCWGDDGGGFYESDDCELTIFTGLDDKNGKEIWEGDILKLRTNGEQSERIIEMKWENHHIGDFFNWDIHGFRDYSKSTYGKEVEVIGNIYENHELISKP